MGHAAGVVRQRSQLPGRALAAQLYGWLLGEAPCPVSWRPSLTLKH